MEVNLEYLGGLSVATRVLTDERRGQSRSDEAQERLDRPSLAFKMEEGPPASNRWSEALEACKRCVP